MKVWKILAGAATGVVAVVALPVFGAVGTVTAVGAAVGAAVGGGAGTLLPDDDDAEAIGNAERRGEARAKAEAALKMEQLRRQYEEASAVLDQQTRHTDLTLALFGVGMACIAHQGEASEDLVLQLKELVGGVAHDALPAAALKKMDKLVASPPNLKSALARARKIAPEAMPLFDDLVGMVAVMLDGAAEHGLRADWTQLRAA
ncbi:hypothetical protein ACLB1G_11970 [Oxalobacteraceae bacterium A2-2]